MHHGDARTWYLDDLIGTERTMTYDREALRGDAVEAEWSSPPAVDANTALVDDGLVGRERTASRQLCADACERVLRLESLNLRHAQ
jgi:hypothetical protein